MAKHDWNFDDAMSVNEFFATNEVEKKGFILKPDCHPYKKDDDGDIITDDEGNPVPDMEQSFEAVGFANGEVDQNGRPQYTWFTLSDAQVKQGKKLTREFLKEHKEDLMLLEPIDGLKFGICFLATAAEDWDEL